MSKMYEGIGLIKIDNGYGYSNWVLRGSENVPSFPAFPDCDIKGILTYGIKKVDDVSCIVIGNSNFERAKALGFKLISQKTYYSYIVPCDVVCEDVVL